MLYRFLCCSDTHGNAPLDLDETNAAAWLHAGDAYDGPSILPDEEPALPQDPLAEPMRAWLRSRKVPVYAVHGNHDVSDPYGWFDAVTSIPGRVIRMGDELLLVGVGWHGERYFQIPNECDLEAACENVRRQMRRLSTTKDRVVLMVYYPPLVEGLFPKKQLAARTSGFEAITQLIRELRPDLIVSGHEHFWFGLFDRLELGDRTSLVVNPGRKGMRVIVDTARAVAGVMPAT